MHLAMLILVIASKLEFCFPAFIEDPRDFPGGPLCNTIRIQGMSDSSGDYVATTFVDEDGVNQTRLNYNFLYKHISPEVKWYLLWSARDHGANPRGFWTIGPAWCLEKDMWQLCGRKDAEYSERNYDNAIGYEPWAGVWEENVTVTCHEKVAGACDWLRGDKCYILHDRDYLTREDARKQCESLSPGLSRLAAPITMVENRYLQHNILGFYPNLRRKRILIDFEIAEKCIAIPDEEDACWNVWGYRDVEKNFVQLNYTDFAAVDQEGDCAIYQSYFNETTKQYDIPLWGVVDCYTKLPFICEVTVNTEALVPPGCKCGVKNDHLPSKASSDYIFGGTEADPNSWPWQVGVYYKKQMRCGGTIISTKEILTAAHCVVDNRNEVVNPIQHHEVVTGDVRKNVNDPTEKWLRVCAMKFHPEYHFSLREDLVILVLCDAMDFTKVASPVCLPQLSGPQPAVNEGKLGVILGWGHQTSLFHAQVNTMSNNACMLTELLPHQDWEGGLFPLGFIKENELCSFYPQRGVQHGDSGGPLMIRGDDTLSTLWSWFQIGVISSNADYDDQSPDISMRVTSYMEWIKDYMGNPTCPPAH